MALAYPFFLVNVKTYEGTAGPDGLAVARTIERVGTDTGRQFALAPQQSDLALVADRTDLPIVAQSAVPREDGGMGAVTLEAVAAGGADAAFCTHPETDTPFDALGCTLDRCADLGLESIVSVRDRETARAALSFDPDCLLFERPADVASDAATIRSDPDRIASFVDWLAATSPETRVFVGGGVRSAADVERAFDCGVDATGAASAAVEATDREAWLRSIAPAIPETIE